MIRFEHYTKTEINKLVERTGGTYKDIKEEIIYVEKQNLRSNAESDLSLRIAPVEDMEENYFLTLDYLVDLKRNNIYIYGVTNEGPIEKRNEKEIK